MKNREHYFRNIFKFKIKSVFFKVLIGYLCLIFLVVLTVGFSFRSLKKTLIQKELNSSQDHLTYIKTIFDNQLIHVQNNMFDFLQSTPNRVKLHNIDKVISQHELIEELGRFKHSSEMIDSCFIYHKDQDFVLSDSGSISKSYFFNQMKLTGKTESGSEDLQAILDRKKSKGLTYVDKYVFSNTLQEFAIEKNLIALLISPQLINNDINFVVMLNLDNLTDLIANTTISTYGKTFILTDGGGVSIPSSGTFADDAEREDLIKKIRTSDTVKGHMELKDNLLVYEKIDFDDIYLVVNIPNEVMLRNLNSIRNNFVFIIFLVSIAGLFIALVFSRLYYAPISEIMSRYKALMPAEIHNTDELTTIGSMFETLDKSNKELMEDSITGDIVMGYMHPETKNIFPFSAYQAAVFKFITDKTNQEILIGAVENLNNENNVVRCAQSDKASLAVIINNDDPAGNVEKLLEARKNAMEISDNFLFLGFGNICYAAEDIHSSYENANLALKYGDSSNESGIYRFEDIDVKPHHVHFPVLFKRQVQGMIVNHDLPGIKNVIGAIFAENRGIANIFMKNLIVEFVNVYMQLMQDENEEIELDLEDINDYINTEFRASKLEMFIVFLYTKVFNMTKKEDEGSLGVASRIKEYIEEHYKDPDLTIEDAAEFVGLSAPYVSTLFKKSMDQGFSQYLLEYRLEKSRVLLEESNDIIKDISSAVGFGTYNHFAKAFRRHYGLSPSKYREIARLDH